MTIRTSKKTVSFKMPFKLDGWDGVLPAGTYVVETDEALVEDVSFPVYRRTSTQIHVHPRPGVLQVLTVEPKDLAAALRRDQATADRQPDRDTGRPPSYE